MRAALARPWSAALLAAMLAAAWPGAAQIVPAGVADEATVSPGASPLIDVLANDLGSGLVLDSVDSGLLGSASVESNQVRYDAGAEEGVDVLAYTAHDGSLVPLAGVLTVTILNQPPVLVLGADPVAGGHDGEVVLAGWATLDAGSPDESGQVLSTEVVDVANPNLFDVQPDLDPDGTLSFTPHPGAFGSTSATAVLSDDGPGDNTASSAFTITITDDAPVAGVLLPGGAIPHVGLSFFDGTVDDGVLSWTWDFGDGGTSGEQHPVHAYERSGSYLVALDVLDDAGQGSHAEETLLVEASPLSADFLLARRVPATEAIDFEDESSGGEGPLTAQWTFDDGAVETGASVQHIFLEQGVHEVRLDVTDDDGTESSVVHSTTVYDSAAGVEETAPGNPVVYTVGDADVSILPPAGDPGGVIDYTFVLSPTLAGLATDGLPTLDGSTRTALLYLEGIAGPAHESDAVGQVQLTFHYAGLGFPYGRLQPWYLAASGWIPIPRSSAPYTVACACPEATQTFYGWTVDPGAQTLTVTAAHASVFGLAGSTATGGGGSLPADVTATDPGTTTPDSPTSPAAPSITPPPDAAASVSTVGGDQPFVAGDLAATLPDGSPFAPGSEADEPIVLSWTPELGSEAATIRFELAAPDGTRHPLADGRFDPAGWESGTYRIEAIDDSGASLDSMAVVVPADPLAAAGEKSAGTALAAAAVSMAVLAGTSVLAAAGVSLAGAASQAASETAASMAEERFYESRLAKAISRVRRLRLGPAAATLAALGLVTLLFAWAAAGSWGGLPSFLLTVGAPSVAMFACCYALDWLIARSCGVAARLRLLGPGALALAVSTLGFRTPVGNPALIDGDEPAPAEGAQRSWTPGDAARAWASLLGYLAFAAPLWAAGLWLGPEVAAVGNAAIVSILATGTLPVSPMTGSSLWHWRKSIALATWLAALGLYVGYATGAVDDTAVAWLGLAALVPFVGLLSAFALSRRASAPRWAAALGRGLLATGGGALRLVPFRGLAGRMSKGWDATQERASQGFRRALGRLMVRRAPAA